ncbi:Flp family type IVb pilin [Mesorhizobium sp. B2-3-15]|nr:Flp family type IVb pilin [Mesorhizobium sp. B2-3-15]
MNFILSSSRRVQPPKGENGVRKFITMTRQFRDDENGAAMVEYTILLGIITVAVIGTVITVGAWVGTQWTTLNTALAGAA